ncbi:Aminoacyl-tRNA editing domain-containing protein [Bifidobacterium sp. DSM 109958]|uniref:Aminoacyl-tRNA editing domain-containing protein n=1 Tax=Bifidobacterium moraviense TaxID=2675323 RepID=A0A7Y0F0E6_9BIFI|nr:YbaK/EbsC family protein [Bifidobacterium sp. DSM 109958]NMM99740.1 Aminoacyl-tRNA editing domain-containing protein [Bifidobacterium sp. DSM 109958]
MGRFEEIVRFAAEHPGEARIIAHETAIVDLESGAEVFDVARAVATYVVEAREGVFAIVASAVGHLRWRQLGRALGLHGIRLASPELVRERTGYDVGTVGPLLLGVPVFLDGRLLELGTAYCGTGDAHHTLEIVPRLIVEHNDVVGYFDGAEFLN